MNMHHVEVINSGDYSFDVKSKDYAFKSDIKGSGITPPDVLLASIGACMGVYVKKYADGAKIALPGFRISVGGELCKDAPHRFKRIDVEIDCAKAALDKRRQAALLDFVKNCPVHNTLKMNPDIEIKLL